jgi:uncharacterized protein (DUF305 family)
MKLNLFRTALLPAAVSAAIAFAGCSAEDSMSGTGHNSANPTASASAAPVGEFNEADVMFAQMMVPHHHQAVDMSDMVLSKNNINPDVEALAKQIKAAQQPEIDMMTDWLETWGLIQMPEGSHHRSSDGMMTEEQMQQLDEANGADGQRLFLEGMIRHHQGAIKMAQAEIASGKNPDAITLAKNIADSQQAEVDTMTELLNKI